MKARIWIDHDTQELCIVFFRYMGKGKGELYNPMTREAILHDAGTHILPSNIMKFSFFESKEVQKSLLEELAQKSDTDEIIQLRSELDATKKHLADLRSLLHLVLNPASPAEKGGVHE